MGLGFSIPTTIYCTPFHESRGKKLTSPLAAGGGGDRVHYYYHVGKRVSGRRGIDKGTDGPPRKKGLLGGGRSGLENQPRKSFPQTPSDQKP